MITIHHLNCGTLVVPNYPTVVCHCLLLQEGNRLVLIDTGIGLQDVHQPIERLGQPLIEMAGFQFHECDTAVRRIEQLGLAAEMVENIVLTHGDPDHAGGLADFPQATVHVAQEELTEIANGHARYVPAHFAHAPRWQSHGTSTKQWFGLEARPLELGLSSQVLLIPLFGHTAGHCGVAIQQSDRWMLHAGDAYYLRAELTDGNHPVSAIATARADNDNQRRQSLVAHLRRLATDHADEVDLVAYHDLSELPAGYPLPGGRE